jgi:signal peptide peptidase SppA
MGCILSALLSVARPKVAVLGLHGVLANNKHSLSLANYQKLIKEAFSVPNVKAVILLLNSPGGSPVQTELLYTYIRTLSEKNHIPVYTCIEDVAASGGYWLACAGDEIYASASSIVGSIGVISAGFGFPELLKKVGIERRVYAQGDNKSILDPFKEEKAADVEILNAVGRDIHQEFITLVMKRRGGALADDPALFTGAFWSGKRAKELGLVDGIGTLYDVLEEKFGKIDVVEIKKKRGLLESLFFGVSAESLVDTVETRIHDNVVYARFGM